MVQSDASDYLGNVRIYLQTMTIHLSLSHAPETQTGQSQRNREQAPTGSPTTSERGPLTLIYT